jgi:chromosome segregation ATPase
MKHAGTAFLVVMLFSTLGLWGIAQQKNGAYASRMRDLETRHAKLEEEQRSFAQQAEKNQRRIANLEAEKSDLVRSIDGLKNVVRERDELRQQLQTRTQDRDTLRNQLTSRTKERDQLAQELRQFSQDLQSLLGRMDDVITSQSPRNGVEALPTSRRSD